MATAAKTVVKSKHHRRSSFLSGALNAFSSGSGQRKGKGRPNGGNAPSSSPSTGGNYSSGNTSQVVTMSGALKEGSGLRRRSGVLTRAQQVAAATRKLQLADHNLRLLIDDINAVLGQENWEYRLHASAYAKVGELNRAATKVAVLKKLSYSPVEHVTKIWHGFVRAAMGRRELDCIGLRATKEWLARGEIRTGMDDVLDTLVRLREALA